MTVGTGEGPLEVEGVIACGGGGGKGKGKVGRLDTARKPTRNPLNALSTIRQSVKPLGFAILKQTLDAVGTFFDASATICTVRVLLLSETPLKQYATVSTEVYNGHSWSPHRSGRLGLAGAASGPL